MAEKPRARVIDGRKLKVTSPGRVLYPSTGTTKADIIGYWETVAEVLIPHLRGRPATRKRWPEGVDGPAFFAKDLEPGTPDWLERVQIRHASGPKFYPVFGSPAALAWLGQVSALELHVPQWRLTAPGGPQPAATSSERHPDRVVFDLDPGPGAGLAECAQVALLLRERLGPLGDRMVPVTSGSKGLHLYVPMDDPITSVQATAWARLAAEQLEKALPDQVVSKMTKSLRANKVFVDWSQNTAAKTTISPYSLRGRESPTVAAPRTWSELTEPGLAHLHYEEVLERLADGIDPLATLIGGPPLALAATADAPVRRPISTAGIARRSTSLPARPRVAIADRPKPVATQSKLVALPPGLAGPVDVALARAEDTIPGPHALPGGSTYELKYDGYRISAVAGRDGARLWSRNRNELTDRFPEIRTALTGLADDGTVLDGEVVIFDGSRLSFDLLQQRLAGGAARIAEQVRIHPASYMVFDLLARNGEDLRGRPWRERRAALEELMAEWKPPLQLSPSTDDPDLARKWMADYRPVGIEGVVAKGAASRYEPGQRRWIKVKSRATIELLVGAVIGPISRPDSLVCGLYRDDGQLVVVARSVQLSPTQSISLAAILDPAGPDHPWPDTIASNRFGGGRDRVVLTKVEPTVVAEVSADTGLQAGVWRHPVRYARYRLDLTPADLPHLASAD